MNDITVESQITLFLAGYGCTVVLIVPFVVMHYCRRAARADEGRE